MIIKYTEHLKRRLKFRNIPTNYPKEIYLNPEKRFYDITEDRNISIKKLRYNGKIRNMMIAYDLRPKHIEIVTIHPITDGKIDNRLSSKRWIKNG